MSVINDREEFCYNLTIWLLLKHCRNWKIPQGFEMGINGNGLKHCCCIKNTVTLYKKTIFRRQYHEPDWIYQARFIVGFYDLSGSCVSISVANPFSNFWDFVVSQSLGFGFVMFREIYHLTQFIMKQNVSFTPCMKYCRSLWETWSRWFGQL